MGIAYNSRIVTDGLVLALDAGNIKSYNAGVSTTTWTDLSGRGNTGTLTNGPTYSSANGGSIVFDGTDDRGTFTSPITSSSPQTYEIWTNAIASASAADAYGYLLHNNNVASTIGSSYLTIGIKPTQRYFGCFNGALNTMDTGTIVSTSNIVQIILSWDGSTQRLYVNGVLKDFEELSVTPQNFSTTTSFGDDKSTTYRMIQGNIYSIKVYSRALTASEVSQNFNALRGRYGI